MIGSNGLPGLNDKRRKQLWWQVPFLLFLVAGTVLVARMQRDIPYQTEHGFVFGTVYNISYQSDENLKTEIEKVLSEVDGEFSMFNEKSTVSRINRGEEPELSEMFQEVYKKAVAVNADTKGAFDVTVAPLVNAWGFGFKGKKTGAEADSTSSLPTAQQVDSLLKIVGMDMLTYDAEHNLIHKKDRRTMLDFSAIAKGYGSDCVASLLRRHNVKNFMVEIGGEVVTQGISPKRLPWRIGVTKPTEDSLQTSQELQTVLNVTDRAMATSGNYRNFYYQGGRRYAHTIDPMNGYPVQHNILSATVIAADCATADAYATSFMVMGLDRVKALLAQHPELMAYIIYDGDDGQFAVWYSPSLKDKINE